MGCCHNLVDLLRQLSRAFDNSRTWLIPPVAVQMPSIFPSLPVEDDKWGGNGGGVGRDGKSDLLPYASELLFIASPFGNRQQERQALWLYCRCKVQGKESDKVGSPLESIELADQPEGGANALNINSLRFLLHEKDGNKVMHSKPSECEEISSSRAFVKKMLEESLIKLQEQNIEGLGIHLKSLKDRKQNELQSERFKSVRMSVDGRSEKTVLASGNSQRETDANQNQLILKSLLSDDGFTRLKESETRTSP
ncbi:hypothetical protein HAX54_002064 [Datura stramonium]|uniref:Uncharacterized protein n=1 Tax=Datura stramonium TaxID=4076 RepID=A0ABS8T4G3_DATST|nr:hypothetical protein [Datura stramonium]